VEEDDEEKVEKEEEKLEEEIYTKRINIDYNMLGDILLFLFVTFWVTILIYIPIIFGYVDDVKENWNDYRCSPTILPISGYINRKIYYPEIQKISSFVLFTTQRKEVDHGEILSQLSQIIKKQSRKQKKERVDDIDDSGETTNNSMHYAKFKKPLGSLLLFVLLNSPILMNIIQKYLPKFGLGPEGNHTYFGLLCRAMLFVILVILIERYI
jgi:hypothetical protein